MIWMFSLFYKEIVKQIIWKKILIITRFQHFWNIVKPMIEVQPFFDDRSLFFSKQPRTVPIQQNTLLSEDLWSNHLLRRNPYGLFLAMDDSLNHRCQPHHKTSFSLFHFINLLTQEFLNLGKVWPCGRCFVDIEISIKQWFWIYVTNECWNWW